MRLLTRWTVAGSAMRRYRLAYRGDDPFLVLPRLAALGPDPDPDEVDRIMPHPSWTSVPRCSECDAQKGAVVELGQEPDVESKTVWVCADCLRRALEMFEYPVRPRAGG